MLILQVIGILSFLFFFSFFLKVNRSSELFTKILPRALGIEINYLPMLVKTWCHISNMEHVLFHLVMFKTQPCLNASPISLTFSIRKKQHKLIISTNYRSTMTRLPKPNPKSSSLKGNFDQAETLKFPSQVAGMPL